MFGGRIAKPARSINEGDPPAQTAGRSASSLLAARIIGAAGGWIGTVVIVRELSRGEFGGYAFIFGLLGVIGLIVDLQISRIVLREILDAGDDAGNIVGSYTLMRTAIGVVAYVAAVAVVIIGNYSDEIVLGTVVAGLGFLFIAPNNGLAVWFHAHLWMRPGATATLIATIVQLALVLGLAMSDQGSLVTFAAAVTIGEFTLLVWRVWCTHVYGLHLTFNVDLRQWWYWLRESIPLAIGFGLVSLYYKLDIILLSQLDTLDAVGQYSIGYKFADLVGFVPYAITTPVMTLMIASWPHAAGRLWVHFRQAFVILFVLGVMVTIGFALVAAPLINTLYGSRYEASVDAARLLVAGAALQFFSYLCFVTLASIGRDRAYAIGGVIGLIINAALNIALIPPFSFEGSAVATVITEVIVFGVLLIALNKTRGIVNMPISVMVRTVIAGVAMAVAYLLLETVVPWFIAGAAAAFLFLGLLHVLRVDGPGGLRALALGARFDYGWDTDSEEGRPDTPISYQAPSASRPATPRPATPRPATPQPAGAQPAAPRPAGAQPVGAAPNADATGEAPVREPLPPILWYAHQHGL